MGSAGSQGLESSGGGSALLQLQQRKLVRISHRSGNCHGGPRGKAWNVYAKLVMVSHTSWYLCKGVKKLISTPDTVLEMFIATLFIIVKTSKQLRCPSVGEWLKKTWCIQTMEYDSALKGNELSSYKKPRKNLTCILLSEKKIKLKKLSRVQGMIPTLKFSVKGKTRETVK